MLEEERHCFEAASAGFDVSGIEIDKNSANDTFTFFKKFLKTEKFKHTAEKSRVNPKSKELAHTLFDVEYAKDKDEFKDNSKHFKLVCGNTKDANKFFKKESFNLIVGDLPYGVAHGNVAKKKEGSITRSPKDLIKLAAMDWYKVLKAGGVICLAWNSFVESKEELEAVLSEVGFKLFKDEVYDEFVHMVDSSIRRDIVVAKK